MISFDQFNTIRNKQMDLFGKPGQNNVDKVLSEALHRSIDQVKKDDTFRVVPAPTGAGKSTSVVAYIVGSLKHDKDFTCSIMTPSLALSHQFYKDIVQLAECCGYSFEDHDLCFIYGDSFLHDFPGDGMNPTDKPRCKANAKDYRIVIGTHQMLESQKTAHIRQGRRDKDTGEKAPFQPSLLNTRTGTRTVTFIDEHKHDTEIIDVRHTDFNTAAEIAMEFGFERLKVIYYNFYKKMVRAMRLCQGEKFTPIDLCDYDPYSQWKEAFEEVELLTTAIGKPMYGSFKLEGLEPMLRFMRLAQKGYAIMNTNGGSTSFCAYNREYPERQAVIQLDATSDLFGSAVLQDSVSTEETLSVNHKNVTITNKPLPKTFEAKAWKRTKKDKYGYVSGAKDFASYIKEYVSSVVQPGEEVLIYSFLEVTEVLSQREDDSIDIGGATCFLTNYGAGVGDNRWKACTRVFMFGNHYLPGIVIRSNFGAHRSLVASDMELPEGKAGQYWETFQDLTIGHALRWTKQGSSRICIRNIDGDGVCTAGDIHVTMSKKEFDIALPRLFPGLLPENVTELKASDHKETKLDRLMDRLKDLEPEVEYTRKQAAADIGITCRTAWHRLLASIECQQELLRLGVEVRGHKRNLHFWKPA